ncbi:hypothetical protein NEOLEDRAFT_1133723 [Neolentinus lepideus HHB14362 ss-1]|uniref:Uncharacterized protein n=1 Tax=Neolentinus lepideus HHB14362 ss-1 TaxID=1314782 RepID=A0A165SLN3_9AGAM|nr:hypothetical protein NEOLEDRAFT_1133723 [Neolentinus lepideus HHB14362 ss-1]
MSRGTAAGTIEIKSTRLHDAAERRDRKSEQPPTHSSSQPLPREEHILMAYMRVMITLMARP